MQEGRQQGPESLAELNDFFLSASTPGRGAAIKVHGTPRQATPASLLLAAQWVVSGSHRQESHRPLGRAQEASRGAAARSRAQRCFWENFAKPLREGAGEAAEQRERAVLGGLLVNPWRCGFICRATAGKGAGPCRALGRLHKDGAPSPHYLPPGTGCRDKCTAPDSAEPHPPGRTKAPPKRAPI